MITFIYYCLYHKSVESFQHDEETFYWFLTCMLNTTNGTSIIKKKNMPNRNGIQNFLTLSEKWEPGSASPTSKLICNDSIECCCESSLQWPPASPRNRCAELSTQRLPQQTELPFLAQRALCALTSDHRNAVLHRPQPGQPTRPHEPLSQATPHPGVQAWGCR